MSPAIFHGAIVVDFYGLFSSSRRAAHLRRSRKYLHFTFILYQSLFIFFADSMSSATIMLNATSSALLPPFRDADLHARLMPLPAAAFLRHADEAPRHL